jgi:hypothetical protein
MATKDELDFAQLADSYDILGQVSGANATQAALAKRKRDGLPVLITAYRDPDGDEGNALNHLASDSKLLGRASHRGIVQVVDSRWMGNALAIVTERVTAPSLAERLARREEEFPFPRIAIILREINAALEWAREQRVVNRGLGLETVFVEEGSDRVRVMFTPQALSSNGNPDDRDDARTIASLARAMLTRSVADPERDSLPLAELRPGLPTRVVEQAEVLIGRAESLEPVDVRAFIAAIAMSEELRRGEDECARVTQEMSEEQRVTREQLAAERKAHEEDLAEQARRFEQEKDEILKTMAREREETAKAMAKEREETARAMAKEREASEKQLRQQRERFDKEMQRQRSEFDREMEKQRASLEKERVRIARARERMERDRERFEKERIAAEAAMAAGAAAAASPAPTTAFETDPDLEDEVLPYEEVVERPVVTPVATQVVAQESLASEDAAPTPEIATDKGFASRWAPTTSKSSRWRDRRVLGAAAVMLLLVIAVAALALGGRGDGTRTLAANTTPQEQVVDSVAGLSIPASPIDSAFARDSISAASPAAPAAPAARPVVRRPRRDTVAAPAPAPVADDSFVPATPFAAPARDSAVVAPLPFARPDSAARPDTLLRRDTIVRRDSIVPTRDTMPAQLPRPDSATMRRSDR